MKKHGIIPAAGIDFTIYTGTPAERDALSDAYGYCDHERQEITLRANMQPALAANTLCHEIGHALYTHSGVEAYVKAQLKDGVDADVFQETLIQLLVPHLAPVFAAVRKLRP